jgi:hypothetical protein
MNKTERFTRLHKLFTEEWEKVEASYPPRPERKMSWATIVYDVNKEQAKYSLSLKLMNMADYVFYWQSIKLRTELLEKQERQKATEELIQFKNHLLSF